MNASTVTYQICHFITAVQVLCRRKSSTSCAILTDASTTRYVQTISSVCPTQCVFTLQSCWYKHSSNQGQPSTKTTKRSTFTSWPMLPVCMTMRMERGKSDTVSNLMTLAVFLSVAYLWGCIHRCVDDLDDTKKALETAHMICSKATVSHTELQVEVPTLFQCLK